MNKEEMRIAIAEACGWTRISPEDPCDVWPCKEYITDANALVSSGVSGMIMKCPDKFGIGCLPPDYLNDLNAMHEAEQTLGANESILYVDNILKLIDETLCQGAVQGCFYQVCATAAQRAEAFLRTLNLYQEKRES